jgi:acetoin utilization protein AcuB
MLITKLMSKNLITLSLDDDLNKAKSLFSQHNIHHILILDDEDKLAGVITDRDLFMHLSPTVGTNKESHKDVSLLHKKIHQIMTRELIVATKEQSLHEAALLFHDRHVSCLPVVDDDNKPIGIITWRDILKVIALQYRKKLES